MSDSEQVVRKYNGRLKGVGQNIMNKLQLLEKIMQVNDFQDFLKLKEKVDLEYACELDKKAENGDLSKVTRHVVKILDKLGKTAIQNVLRMSSKIATENRCLQMVIG